MRNSSNKNFKVKCPSLSKRIHWKRYVPKLAHNLDEEDFGQENNFANGSWQNMQKTYFLMQITESDEATFKLNATLATIDDQKIPKYHVNVVASDRVVHINSEMNGAIPL